MGNRISISFNNGNDESVALFSHWDGMALQREAEKYKDDLIKDIDKFKVFPLGRLEPNTVMLDFIRHLAVTQWKNTRVSGNYYLGENEDDGDNSDNGHKIIKLK